MGDKIKETFENYVEYTPLTTLTATSTKDPMEELLSMYRKEKIAEIDIGADKAIQKAREQSKLGKIYNKILKYAEKELKDAYKNEYEKIEHKIYIAFDNEEETQKNIDKIIEARNEHIEEVDEKLKRIKALLTLTENYEQKIDVLKRYGILDEDGIF